MAPVRERIRDEYLEVRHLERQARQRRRDVEADELAEYAGALVGLLCDEWALMTLALMDLERNGE